MKSLLLIFQKISVAFGRLLKHIFAYNSIKFELKFEFNIFYISQIILFRQSLIPRRNNFYFTSFIPAFFAGAACEASLRKLTGPDQYP